MVISPMNIIYKPKFKRLVHFPIFAAMEEIYSYYKENIDAYTRRLGNLKKKIHLMGSIRLALVAGAIPLLMDIQG